MTRPGPLGVALATVLLAGLVLFAVAEAKRSPAKPARAAAPAAPRPGTSVPAHRVIAYYFHTNFRCVNCRRIEEYSHAAIESTFTKELADGRLVWRVVNVEDAGNEHFVKDYQLATKSLVLADEVGGRQRRWKNCARVWQLLGDREGFLRYVQGEVRGYLAEAP